MRAVVLALSILLTSASSAAAEKSELPAPAAAIAEQFLTKLKQGAVAEAFHTAMRDLEPRMGPAAIDSVAGGTEALLKSYGSIVDWSEYQTDRVTPSMFRRTYFVRTESIPLFVTVQFYNPGQGWRMVDVQLNTYTNGMTQGLYDAVPARD